MNLFSKQSKEEEPVLPPSLMLIPGEYFFIEKITGIDDEVAKDLDSFIEIQLEGVSPFSLDQLYWGYLYNKAEQSMLLYAMYIGRLTNEEKDRILSNEISYVFPSFIAGLGHQYNEPTVNFIASGTSLSALYWNKNTLPIQIETIAIKESESQTREELLKTLNTKEYKVEAGYWQVDKMEILADRSVRFENRYQGLAEGDTKPNHIFVLHGKDGTTWNADIRSVDITKAKFKEQKTTHVVWLATLGVLAAFGLLIIGEALWLMGKMYLNAKESRFKDQAPKVKLIEAQESLTQKIEQITKKNLTPFQMLALLNNSRPKNVYFTSVTIGNDNRLVIEGASATVDDLNKYTDDLHKTGIIENFEVSQIASRQGRVTFKMDVKFKPPVAQEAVQPLEASPEVVSEPKEGMEVVPQEQIIEKPQEAVREINNEVKEELATNE